MGETHETQAPNLSAAEPISSSPREKDNILDLEDFRSLQTGSHIEIHRTQPSKIAGYLGYLVVPTGGIGDIYEEVQQSYGGGKYQLRAKKLRDGGGLKYALGAVQIAIGGYPVQGGQHYINDQWRPIPVPVAPMAPAPMGSHRQPERESASDGLAGIMKEFVSQALQANLRGEPTGVKLTELPSLLTAIGTLQGPQRERDGFGDLERAFGLIEKLERRREAASPAPAAPTEGMGMEQILQMLAMKFLGQQNQPQAPVSAPPVPSAPVQNYPPYPADATGQQMWEQAGAQPPGQPPGWTAPPVSSQAAGGPAVGTVPPSAAAPAPQASPPTPAPDDAGEFEPLTVDEVMEDLAARDEQSREKFIGGLCERLGLDQAILANMFPDGPPSIPLDGKFPEAEK